VAKNSNTFFSKLAPEDKRFIKRVGIVLFILVIASGAGMYFFTYFEKQKMPETTERAETPAKETPSNTDSASTSTDTITDASVDTSTVFELPDAPELSDAFEMPNAPETSQADERSFDSKYDSFDEQSHLQLMRQNVKEYNYKLAYKHGFRIEKYLLSNSALSAEWGHVLLEAGMPQDALLVLQKQASSGSMNGEAAMDLAFAMHRSGNSEDAIHFLDSQQKNKSADILAAKAAIVGEHSDTTKRFVADSIFKYALKINSGLPIVNYYYGRYLMQKGDFKNSKFYLERALKARPDEPRYVARLGMAEFYLKRDANAEILYKKALKLNPHDYNTWFNLGELYLSQANESNYVPEIRRKIRMALEAYLKTIEMDSEHANAHSRIGLILNGNGEHAEAIRHLNIALERMPRNTLVMHQLSSAYLYMQDTARSIDYLEKILTIDPFNKIAANEFNRIKGDK